MDEPGFHARRRAEREMRRLAREGKLGHLQPSPATQPLDNYDDMKDALTFPQSAGTIGGGYEVPGYRPPPVVLDEHIPGPGTLPLAGPLQEKTQGKRRMYPTLAMMTGPMLRYDTVINNIWHGFLMIVTSDSGSQYQPISPNAVLEWDNTQNQQGFQHFQPEEESDQYVNRRSIQGIKIFTYHGIAGPQSFWRFKLEVPLAPWPQEVFYSINHGRENSFHVPAIGQNMRWVGHSCNGFSAGVDTAAFNGPDPLWRDVLREHDKSPIHVVIGGGDQIYCDPLTKEPEFIKWINEQDEKVKIAAPMTDDMKLALDRFFFNHYCKWFRSGAFGETISRIPMLNICDDHDLIDGFGSYPDDLQRSPVFSTIGARGIFWYLLFQHFIVDDVDGTSPVPFTHPVKSCIIGGEGAWIPFPSHSFLSYLGPKVFILLLDCRIERKKNQICTQTTYDRVFHAIKTLPQEVDHLVMLLGVPPCYPRMNAIENVLESKFNPMSLLAKAKIMPSAVNKFNSEAELLDDLNDHWTAGHHKQERNKLIERCQQTAVECRLRITFLSGDVHACCISKLYHKDGKVDPARDPKYMLAVVSSAIVNTPPPPAVITMVSTLGKKRHKTLHYVETDEELIPMFETDTDGSKLKNNTVMGRRNYCLANYDATTGELDLSLQVETEQGKGTTKSYAIRAPPPRW
ncbi:hypothetical protein OIO90_000088 [Microbotryomycetes sp. JL221]|nr:hypothetical protein OIO90_000088 [Microbotryomycetes sp. JL221]